MEDSSHIVLSLEWTYGHKNLVSGMMVGGGGGRESVCEWEGESRKDITSQAVLHCKHCNEEITVKVTFSKHSLEF